MESRKLSYFLSYSADFAWFSILLTRKKMKIAKKSGNNENLAKRSERILAFLHRKLFRSTGIMSAVLTCFFVVGINLEKAAQYWPSWDFEGSSCWWLEVLPSEVPPLRASFRCQQTIWRWNLQFSLVIFESTCWNSPSQIQLQTSCAHTLKLKNSTDTSAAYMSQMSLKMICHSTEPTILFCSLQEVCLQEKSLRCRILQKMSRSIMMCREF